MKKALSIQINIPEPCHEDWNTMSPCEQGRFCAHCQKHVIDFTTWSDTALYQFFSKNDAPVCGRFSAYQIDRPIHIPHQPHSRLYRIAIGLGLVLIFTQATEATARTRAPFVVEQLVDNPGDKNDSTGTGMITGIILNEAKQPIPNALIEIVEAGVVKRHTNTDNAGYYSLREVEHGTYDINISCGTFTTLRISGIIVVKDYRIELPLTLKIKTSTTESITVVAYKPSDKNVFLIRRELVIGMPAIVPDTLPDPGKTIIKSDEIEKRPSNEFLPFR